MAATEHLAERVGIDPDRLVRFVEFGAVGASGSVLNFAVFLSVIGATHYVVAGAAAFAVAVTWNFGANWWITYGRPEGRVLRQYLRFVEVSLVGFVFYLGGLVLGIDVLGLPPVLANALGVGIGAIWNFAGAEAWAFETVTRPSLLNAAVHRVATSGVRERLRSVGVYDLLYRAYMAILGRVYRRDEADVDIGGASATLSTATAAETVSVLHSVEKERDLLEQFVTDLEAGDRVWDIGANLGVYGCLAGDVVDEVVAIEPYPPTVDRLRANLERNAVAGEVLAIALGSESREVELGIERADVGTQTPAVGADYGKNVAVPQKTGDQLVEEHGVVSPTVLKIDVEGSEMDVLEGLKHTLPSVRLVYVETHGDGDRVREFLGHVGFDTRTIDVDGHQVMIRADLDTPCSK